MLEWIQARGWLGMNHEKAIIDGVEYHFIELLPSLDDQGRCVLCTDSQGGRYVCPEELWNRQVPQSEQTLGINTDSTAQEKIALFLSLFCGREDVYARRYYSLKSRKSGYVPACKNEWVPGVCDKKAYRCPDCPNRVFMPLTAQAVKAHLIGQDPYCRDMVGLYPMLEGDRTRLWAVDFDKASWREDVSAFRDTCVSLDLTPAVERSRSGNGAHVWFFFSEPAFAVDARKLGSGLLTRAMARRHELRSQSPRFHHQESLVPQQVQGFFSFPFKMA